MFQSLRCKFQFVLEQQLKSLVILIVQIFSVNEFINKEGKWFNYIRGKAGSLANPNNANVFFILQK